ncbi:unnamed protein product [Phytophthora lilii]|uniref:Unnamed protein product n=1 Tax=Phytophthora lilii TaxID=2077276 RepID=A0A9W6U925_9STRA|nr:unnamed protein product [Phytophthora lilii]
MVADALSRAPAAVRAVAGSQAARQHRTNAGDEDAGERTPATKTLDDARLGQTVTDVARRVLTPPTAAAEETARRVLPAHAGMDNKMLNQTVVPTLSTAIAETVARRVPPAPTVSKRTRAVTRSMARQASDPTQPVEPVEHAAAGHARAKVAGEAGKQQPPARRPRREQHVHWADANSASRGARCVRRLRGAATHHWITTCIQSSSSATGLLLAVPALRGEPTRDLPAFVQSVSQSFDSCSRYQSLFGRRARRFRGAQGHVLATRVAIG